MPTTIIDVRIPADVFPLGRILQSYPEVEIELERIVPTRDQIIPLFWVTSADEEAVEETLRADSLVEEVHLLTRTPDRVLYAVDWSPEVDGLIGLFVEFGVEVLAAEATVEAWEFHLQFRDRSQLMRFRRACQDAGIDLELVQLYNPMMPEEGGILTAAEHDVLAAAYENGYWDVPRETTQQELARFIGISETETSEILRTAVKRVVEEKLYGPSGEPYL